MWLSPSEAITLIRAWRQHEALTQNGCSFCNCTYFWLGFSLSRTILQPFLGNKTETAKGTFCDPFWLWGICNYCNKANVTYPYSLQKNYILFCIADHIRRCERFGFVIVKKLSLCLQKIQGEAKEFLELLQGSAEVQAQNIAWLVNSSLRKLRESYWKVKAISQERGKMFHVTHISRVAILFFLTLTQKHWRTKKH